MLSGVGRDAVVADTDEWALVIARRAYPRWRRELPLAVQHGTNEPLRDRDLSADLRRTHRPGNGIAAPRAACANSPRRRSMPPV